MTQQHLHEAARWAAEAEEDLQVSKTLRSSGHYSHACFHAQQAAEKAVKAFLYACEVDDPWGHSVARLAEEAATFKPEASAWVDAGAKLDRYYVPTRYPNGLPGGLPSKAFFADDARDAIQSATTIVSAVQTHLKEAGGGDL